MDQQLRCYRRYCLLARRAAVVVDRDIAGSLLWRAKQESEPGTALPDDFPQLEALSGAGYTTVEDLDGANDVELIDAGFTADKAGVILAALQPLL